MRKLPDESVVDVVFAMVKTPWGSLRVVGDDCGLQAIDLAGGAPDAGQREDRQVLAEAIEQLSAYAHGELRVFDLPLNAAGTPFQRQVWDLIARIPYGTTSTYGDLALLLGKPGASRAVGLASGKNPLPIVVPCHRVIGAGGKLTGFAGGLPLKRALLDHEGVRIGADPGQLSLFG